MRLIIRHYLSLLKESGELDALLPDILLGKGIQPISKPQKGTRQYGVDIAAVGRDDEDGRKKLFLFTVKPGDFGRADWDNGTPQAVRPSLIDILETYIPTHVSESQRNLPIKIVIVAGGNLKQNLQVTWAQFTSKHAKDHGVEFDFWGGDQLAIFIEESLLNEYLLPVDCQKLLRKAIAFAGDPNYDLRDFYHLLHELYADVDVKRADRKRRVCSRQIRTALLCNLVFGRWAEDEENLKNAFLATERLVLLTWDYLRRHDLLGNKRIERDFFDCYSAFHWASSSLFGKIQQHCHVQDGLFRYGGGSTEHPLRVFEFIGIVSLIGLDQCYIAHSIEEGGEKRIENALAIVETLKSLINNNPISNSPAFDSHANEIALALMLLIATKNSDFAKGWLSELISRVSFNFNSETNYPIATDSYEDLLAFRLGTVEKPEKLKFCSTLLPLLAEFALILADEESYQALFDGQQDGSFKALNFQTWVPDETTEQHLYSTNAGFTSGICFYSIVLPEELDDFKAIVLEAMKHCVPTETFSCFERGMPILSSMSSRHFRTPPIPAIWRNPFLKSNA